MRKILALSLIALWALSAACGQDSRPVVASQEPADNTSSASCVESYSLENLEKRDYAFDGTIKSIESESDGSDAAVFEVEKWFKGGEGATATRKGTFSSITSAGGEERKVGDRLLVAGDDDFAWDCGFTQLYDAEVAADWEAALGR